MAKRPKHVIGVDLGRSVFKLVSYSHARKRISWVTKKLVEAPTRDGEEDLVRALREILENPELKVNPRVTELVLAVDARHAALREVPLSADERDPQAAVQWETGQYLAAPLADFAISCEPVIEGKGPVRRYLTTAFRRAELDRFRRVAERLGYSLRVVDVDLMAARNALEANYPETARGRVFLVKADLHSIACLAMTDGHFAGYRCAPVGQELLYAEDEERNRILSEVAGQAAGMVKELEFDTGSDKPPLFLCGDLTLDFEFGQSLGGALGTEAQPLDSFRKVSFPAGRELAELKSEHAPQFAAALGLALRFGGDRK